jgi:hypothetical protein
MAIDEGDKVLREIHGLPAHILLVHAVVVLLPLAAVLLVVGAAWPVARRRIGVVGPVLALIVLVLVPITTSAGNWLRDRVDPSHANAAIEHHEQLSHGLLPWAIGLFVVSSAVWLLGRRYEFGWRPESAPGPDATSGTVATKQATALPVWVSALVVVVAAVVAVGAVIDVIRIGDAGSQAVWGGLTHN